MKDLITVRALNGVTELIECYGVSVETIARRVGVDANNLSCPELEISVVKVNDFLEEAAIVCEDRFFGIKLAQYQSFDILEGDLNMLVKYAPTIRELLTVFVDGLAQHCQALSVCLLPDRGGVSTCYETRGGLSDVQETHGKRVQGIELGIAIACRELKAVLGKNWRPSRVQFRHSAPQNLEPLKNVFGSNIFFNQDVNALYLTKEECDRQWAIETLKEELPDNTEERQQENKNGNSPFILAVDQAMIKLLNGDSCTVQKVADILGLKLRTFQYRLSQENKTYQGIYDDIRFDLAKEYLCGSNLMVIDISDRLHFTDPTAFSRFFKIRAGVSPAAFRKSIA